MTEVMVHTGQHYDAGMSDIFFTELAIPKPQHHLGIGGGSHGEMTGRMLAALEAVMLTERPDWVLVYGDTNSTLAGALAAAKLHLRIAHVEAGLRSFNRRMPEEINRVLTDHAADLLFAPTSAAAANLTREGIAPTSVHTVGDVMFDAALFFRQRAVKPDWWEVMNVAPGAYVLATVHRAENTDDPTRLRAIMAGLAASPEPVILPLHPRTRARLEAFGIPLPAQVRVVPPVGYLEMVWLEVNAALIATDSGGVQKEAFFHSRPCITLRDETEWMELVDTGWNTLVGADTERIAEALARTNPLAPHGQPDYGDGHAAAAIVRVMKAG